MNRLRAALAIAALLALAGCNTVAGAGEDITSAAHAVGNAVKKVGQGL